MLLLVRQSSYLCVIISNLVLIKLSLNITEPLIMIINIYSYIWVVKFLIEFKNNMISKSKLSFCFNQIKR